MAVQAQALIHHAYFLGLQLKAASQLTAAQMEDWMFRLFRRQHEDKFLSSFSKLGLSELPHAVACAQYHVMSNAIGGVSVEYMPEIDTKAWVRFRYPRWMYAGPTLCGLPVEVSRGFLRGWYAHNGVSLNNPRLGFVCVSEDMTGQYGLCGYFKQYDYELREDQRLQFAPEEVPPPYQADQQPSLPAELWSAERLAKANRNYAIDYVRNGLIELSNTVGKQQCISLAGEAAYLIGLQYMQETLQMVHGKDDDLESAVDYLLRMFSGLGDNLHCEDLDQGSVQIIQSELRLVKGLNADDSILILECWHKLWLGTLASFRIRPQVQAEIDANEIRWSIGDL